MDGMGSFATMPILDLVDLRDVIPPAPRKILPRISEIKTAVSRFYGVAVEDLESACRKKAYTYPRQIAVALSRELTLASYPAIARHMGDRHHTTILHADRKIKARERKNVALAREMSALRLDIAAAVTARRTRMATA